MKTAKLLGVLAAIGLAYSSQAGATSWDTVTTGISVGAVGGSIYCGSGGTLCNTTGTGLSGSVISMRAYSTPTLQGTANTTPVDTGNWVTGRMAIYGGAGTGITNTVESSGNEPLDQAPQHAIDNYGVNDILVIDFGSSNWDVSSFNLGYTCTINSTSGGTSCSGSTVNVEAWVGGTTAINFTNVAFASSGTGAAINTNGQGTFYEMTLTNDPGGTGTRSDTTSPNRIGRYLIITGDLSSFTDSFKVSGVVATQTTGVPLPGTAPLFALGLLALGFAFRRRPVPVRAAA